MILTGELISFDQEKTLSNMRSNKTNKGNIRDARGTAHASNKPNHNREMDYSSIIPSPVYGVIPFYGQPMTSQNLLYQH